MVGGERQEGLLGHFDTNGGLGEIMLRNYFGERFGNDQHLLLSRLKAVILNNTVHCYTLVLTMFREK